MHTFITHVLLKVATPCIRCFPYKALVDKGVKIIGDGHNLKNINKILIRAVLMVMSYGTV
jgi:hypothetical protein